MVRNGLCTGNISLWRDCNANVMIYFKNKFERLESLGQLDPDDSTCLWSLNYVFMDPMNQKINQLKNYFHDYPRRS